MFSTENLTGKVHFITITGTNIKGILLMVKKMEEVCIHPKMDINTMGIGKTIKGMERP